MASLYSLKLYKMYWGLKVKQSPSIGLFGGSAVDTSKYYWHCAGDVLVSYWCYDIGWQTQWLKTTQIYHLSAPEDRSQKCVLNRKNITVLAQLCSLWRFGGELISWPLSASRDIYLLGFYSFTPSSRPAMEHFWFCLSLWFLLLVSHLLLSLTLLSLLWDTCDYMRPTCVIKDTLPISRPLT